MQAETDIPAAPTPPVQSGASARGSLMVPRKAARRVKIIDRLAGGIIRFGGASVIIAVAAIFVFIGREALPLFLPAESSLQEEADVPGFVPVPGVTVVGVDEYETFAYWLHPTGALHLVALEGWKPADPIAIPALQKHTLSSAYRSAVKDHLYLGTKDGHVLLAQVRFSASYSETGRVVKPRLVEEKLLRVSEAGSPVTHVFGRHDSQGRAAFAALCADGSLAVGSWEEGGDAVVERVGGQWMGRPTHLAVSEGGRALFLATDAGRLYHWELQEDRESPFQIYQLGDGGRRVTAMDFVIGDHALVLGFNDGRVEQWFGVRDNADDTRRLFRRIRTFESLPAAATTVQPSGRDKGFVVGGEDGSVRLYFTTSGRTLVRQQAAGAVAVLCYAPKLTSLLATSTNGHTRVWSVRNPHPEISLGTLFGKVWYEGYDRPEFTWQSTGGSDDFESKFSLVPLIVGTLKGAFYGLLFAVPIAVLAALYTSQFMHFRIRALVKPAVEIMAALPSVVIGFLAGLWLAPLLERHVLSVVAMIGILPLLILVAVIGWQQIPMRQRAKIPAGMELALIIPLVGLALWAGAQLGPWLEDWFFHGDLRQWVYDAFGQQFEQRNSIVIGFAMGFAVIPIIFTISEDALSNVPQHFISGSLALGASRWQTATRIILPTASPGIFSGVMVGFGRAVGETMIVLMATGNTPILSFSPFNGMRTLSANIAVEIPEAPVGGTLYRVLFLAAILLFLMTFVVNTVAEVIRQRLREKYQAV
ncbi:MAG TPA: ABC transporter permease subunit [Methylomirabilota bacterium]|nr:ABC transporter permease subunit [Methylomirabilota bacterium]